MTFRSFLAGLTLLAGPLLPATAFAQAANRIADPNTHAWYQYFGDHRLGRHWGLHTEAQLRRASWINDPQQLLLRAGLNLIITEQVMLTAGYAFVETYPYGDYPAPKTFPEHRLYEQLSLNQQPLGRLALNHRYRLEQRWITFPGQSKAQLLHRARYQVRATLPLNKPKMEADALYLFGFDEIFIGFGENVAANIFDQNRLGGGLGFKFNRGTALETGYMSQIVQQRNGRVFEYNKTLTVALTANLDRRRPDPTPAQ